MLTHTHPCPSSLMRQGLLCSLSARLRLPDPSDPSAFLSEVIGSPCKYYTTMTGSKSHSVPFPQCPWPLPVNRRWAGVIVQIQWPFTSPKLALPGNHPRTFLRSVLECVTCRHDLSVYLPSLLAISVLFLLRYLCLYPSPPGSPSCEHNIAGECFLKPTKQYSISINLVLFLCLSAVSQSDLFALRIER